VSSISEHSITVQLLEYNKIEGMITQAEYSKTGRSKYNQGILKLKKHKKQEICSVIRVDKVKGYIDLSKKAIKSGDTKDIDERFEKGKKVQSLLYPLCDALKMNMETLYQMIVWPLQRKDEHAYDAFNRAIFDFEGVIGPLNLDPKVKEKFEVELKKKFTPQPVKIKAIFELRSYDKEGIEQIKKALLKGQEESSEEIPLKINLIAPPLYIVQTTTLNKDKGILVVQNCLNKIKEDILSRNGKFEEKEFIKNADEKEQDIEKLYELNKKDDVDGDGDEDDDETMGKMDIGA
jgi:translation initiation factor 2 subunit 1